MVQTQPSSSQAQAETGQPESLASHYRTIKHNHLFLIDDFNGNIPYGNQSGLGLYHLDTRFLSCLEIKLHHTDLVPLLSSTEKGYLSNIVYTNSQFQTHTDEDELFNVRPETIQLKRESVLNGSLFEKYTLISYNDKPIRVQIAFRFDADFRDIFDVRNIVNDVRGTLKPSRHIQENNQSELRFGYLDRSGQPLETRIIFKHLAPRVLPKIEPPTVVYEALLEPREPFEFDLEIQTNDSITDADLMELPANVSNSEEAFHELEERNKDWAGKTTHLTSDNEDFNEMMLRSRKDIQMLVTRSTDGVFIAAGIPWYVSLFGRDSLITARFCLMLYPNLARYSLKILAQFQGKEFNPWRDEEPGKILHEFRVGELARVGAIPHTPYYGSVDASPLWIILLYEYYQWTGDIELMRELWPNALAALACIDCNMEQSPLGYMSYECQSERGIFNQGWKDSHDSVMDCDGTLAEVPVSLVEVQGYVYLAKKYMAIMAEMMGDNQMILRLVGDCAELKQRFNEDFWVEDLGFYAIALDAKGRPMRVVSSNPGHCLETGIMDEDKATRVSERLMHPDMFNGWGLRTLSFTEKSYNPMSYHNGSVWPHDNAMICKGLAVCGFPEYVEKITSGIFDAARHISYKRLPELFCGFSRDDRREGDPPVRYPVACSPQAWAAASMYSMIPSMLNLNVDATKRSLSIRRPRMPKWLDTLELKNLNIGSASVDLTFRRTDTNVMVDVPRREGPLDINIEI